MPMTEEQMTYADILRFAAALGEEKTVWDKTNNIVYIPGVNDDGKWSGIQMFYLQDCERDKAYIEKEGITQFCLGTIPAPGAAVGNKSGYSSFYGFIYDEDGESTRREIVQNLVDFVETYLGCHEDAEYEIQEG